MKLSVLMPVYNEQRTLRAIVQKVLDQQVKGVDAKEIVIVDDCSDDGSAQIIRELHDQYPEIIKPIYQECNQGKGSAIARAIKMASGDIAIIQDADLEYDPTDYCAVLAPILDGDADVVYGSRFIVSDRRRVLYFRHAIGNRFLTLINNLCTDLFLTDMETCYKAFDLGILKTIPLRSKRFGIEPEITAKIAKRNLRVYEVPISYRGRTYSEGKKIGWKDGLQALWIIFKYWVIDDCIAEHAGHQILSEMGKAPRFYKWTLDLVRMFVGSRVLEVGSGIGNNISYLSAFTEVIATDRDPRYMPLLKKNFDSFPNVTVAQWDVTQSPPPFEKQPDTILCSNVLEHIENEAQALGNIHQALSENGVLILIVPQGPHLYSRLDQVLEHYRRYSHSALESTVKRCGFQIEHQQTFNKVGVLGWFVQGKLRRATSLGKSNMLLYNFLTPLFCIIDRFLPWKGLSWIVIARKVNVPVTHETSTPELQKRLAA